MELFVQDGGSTDGSQEILRRFPIRWASEPDTGISQALMRAVKASDGEIIGITCTDDMMQPGAVSAAVAVFTTSPEVIMVYGDCYEVDLRGRPFKLWKSMPFDLDWLCWECYIPGQTVYLRRTAFLEVGGFDENLRLTQDLDLWLRLGAHYPSASFRYVPKVMGCYRVVQTSAGLGNPRESIKCLSRVIQKFLDNPTNVAQLRKGRHRALAGMLLVLVVCYLQAGERRLAWKTYLRAVKSYPPLLVTKKGIMTLPQLLAGDWLRRLYRQIEQACGRIRRGQLLQG